MKTRRQLFAMVIAALSMFFVGAAHAEETLRVAIAVPGSITDQGWNQAGHDALRMAEEELGIEVAISEHVEQPQQLEVLSDYARRGYDLVIGHGGEFQDAVERVAKRFPDTMFMVNNGLGVKTNVANADFYFSQLGYLMGYTAAKMSETNKIGIIAAQKFKFTLDTVESYEAGAKAANAKTEVFTTWTGDWDDVAKGKEAALNQISQGADVVWPTMDSATVGSLQAVKEKGVYGIGIYGDSIENWPDIIIQSAILDVRQNMLAYLRVAAEGKLEGKLYKADLTNAAAMRIGSFHPDVPQSVQDEVLALIEKMKSGELQPQPY